MRTCLSWKELENIETVIIALIREPEKHPIYQSAWQNMVDIFLSFNLTLFHYEVLVLILHNSII